MSTAPRRLGKYELQQMLGRGHVGEVWKARDVSIHQDVALKLVHSDFQSDPHFLTRFNHDGERIASLRQPNIVPTRDFTVSRTLQANETAVYFVMEYIQGQSLAQYIHMTSHRGAIPAPSEIVYMLESLSVALDYAHQREIIHGAITPDNILLNRNNTTHMAAGEPLLTDIGLAEIVGNSGTVTTPAYVSPEQARGLPPTSRSDIYALGVILYEICTGVVPFRGETSVAVMTQHINILPTPPILINPNIPPALSEAILRAMAKEPLSRFAVVSLFANAVADACSIQPTLQITPSSFNEPQAGQAARSSAHSSAHSSILGVSQPLNDLPPFSPRPFAPRHTQPLRSLSQPLSPTSDATAQPLAPGSNQRSQPLPPISAQLSQPMPAISLQNSQPIKIITPDDEPAVPQTPRSFQGLPPRLPSNYRPQSPAPNTLMPDDQSNTRSGATMPKIPAIQGPTQRIATPGNPGVPQASPSNPFGNYPTAPQASPSNPFGNNATVPQASPANPFGNYPQQANQSSQPASNPPMQAPWDTSMPPFNPQAANLPPVIPVGAGNRSNRSRSRSILRFTDTPIYIVVGVLLILLLAIGSIIGASLLTNKNQATTPPPATTIIHRQVVFQDDALGKNDQLHIDLQNVTNPPDGKTYFAWLVNTNKQTQPLGAMELKNGSIAFAYMGDNQHTNLLTITQGVLITLEDAGTTPAQPGDKKVYQGMFNPAILPALKNILAASQDLPGNPGIATGLFETVKSMNDKAGSIVDSLQPGNARDPGLAKRQATRIIEMLDGSEYAKTSGDLPANVPPQTAVAIGLLSAPNQTGYVDALDKQLDALQKLPDNSPTLRQHIQNVKNAVGDLRDWLQKIRTDDIQILKADLNDPAILTVALQQKQLVADAYTGRTIPPNEGPLPMPGSAGSFQAYSEAHYLATLDLKTV